VPPEELGFSSKDLLFEDTNDKHRLGLQSGRVELKRTKVLKRRFPRRERETHTLHPVPFICDFQLYGYPESLSRWIDGLILLILFHNFNHLSSSRKGKDGTMKCPKCESENPDTQRFYGDCGTDLDHPSEDLKKPVIVPKILMVDLKKQASFTRTMEAEHDLDKEQGGLRWRLQNPDLILVVSGSVLA
jgi:hypothetical protein